MRFATWNIACGASGYNGKDLDGLAAALRQTGADVCALQEVDRYAARSGFADVAAELATRLGMSAFFKTSYPFERERADLPAREYGCCLLSRFPLADTFQLRLNDFPLPEGASKWEQRVHTALFAKVLTDAGPVLCGATHLVYAPELRPSAVRALQVQSLLRQLSARGVDDLPFVLGGDFNAAADNPDLAPLAARYTLASQGVGFTWPLGGEKGAGRQPFVAIDHIFCTKSLKAGPAYKADLPTLSDHALVWAELTTSL